MEQEKWNEQITELSKSIYSFCRLRTSNSYDAEDLAQDILAELMRSLPALRKDTAFYSFAWTVARNSYAAWCRRKARELPCSPLDGDDEPAETDSNDSEEKEAVILLRRELALLSKKYRKAVILYYIDRLPCTEISSRLSVSESMVKYLLFKARKLIKEGMEMERTKALRASFFCGSGA